MGYLGYAILLCRGNGPEELIKCKQKTSLSPVFKFHVSYFDLFFSSCASAYNPSKT